MALRPAPPVPAPKPPPVVLEEAPRRSAWPGLVGLLCLFILLVLAAEILAGTIAGAPR